MAVSNAALNRSQDWSSDQKKVLRKVFATAQSAALAENSALVSRSIVHTQLAGKLDSLEEQDIRSLMEGIRYAIDNNNASYDLQPHFTADRWTGNKRRVIKAMAQAVVDQIPAP